MAKQYLAFTKQVIDPSNVSELTFKNPYIGGIPSILKGSFLAGIIDGSENEKARSLLEQMSLALSSTLNR